MQIEFKDTEDSKTLETNEDLESQVSPETPLMEMIVQYIGCKYEPVDERVNLEMIISTLAEECPVLVLALSEENFMRGYEQALSDLEAMRNTVNPEEQSENV